MISLQKARASTHLNEFVAQETKREIGPISISHFDKSVEALVKERPPQDQTSGSRVRGGSTGTKTR